MNRTSSGIDESAVTFIHFFLVMAFLKPCVQDIDQERFLDSIHKAIGVAIIMVKLDLENAASKRFCAWVFVTIFSAHQGFSNPMLYIFRHLLNVFK